jgi:hypothetical protein
VRRPAGHGGTVITSSAIEITSSAIELEELEHYNRSHFKVDQLPERLELPLPDEPFVEAWLQYAAEAAQRSVHEVLREHLVQLRFPVEAGISASSEYQAAVGKGVFPPDLAAGLQLVAPEKIRLLLHQTQVGRIPVILVGERADFIALVRALVHRNEPVTVPDSQGALMLSGYNNWSRVAQLRQRFDRGELAIPGAADWVAAFSQIRERKELYQDRVLLLSPGPYSGVPAAWLGLEEGVWHRLSLAIRLEHECAHYVTRRLLNSMRNNLLDELIADYNGIVATLNHFNAAWLLCFMGLEHPRRFRAGGRLSNYRGDPPLSNGAFSGLQQLARQACRNLEAFDRTLTSADRSPVARCRMILALARLTLDELADDRAVARIRSHYQAIQATVA